MVVVHLAKLLFLLVHRTTVMFSSDQPSVVPSSYQPAFGQPQQPVQPAPAQPAEAAPAQDPTTKLLEMKKLLDAGAISQEEYDKVKAQVLGL